MMMEPRYVTVTDAARTDLGEFAPVSFDHAHGDDENTFTLTAYADQFTTAKGGLVYIDGGDLGGIIDDISVSLDASAQRIVTYKGRTFTGILGNLVVQPDSGQDYYTASGEANAVLGQVITHLGAGDIFSASAADSGLTVSFTFPRYVDAYMGLRKMADSCGGILHHAYDHVTKRVILSVEARPTLPEISNEQATITLASRRPYNHVIVGGIGELKDRVIVHRYADASGNISTTQTFTGADERAYFYDLNTAEQADAEEAAEEWLANAQGADTTTVEVTGESLEFDVGDHVTVSDPETGTAAEVVIGKKIVRIDPYDGYTARYVTANETGARIVSGEGGAWNYRPNLPAVYYDETAANFRYGAALQDVESVTYDISSKVTPGANTSVHTAQMVVYGGAYAQVFIRLNNTQARSAGTAYHLCTLDSSICPAVIAGAIEGTMGFGDIDGGRVTIRYMNGRGSSAGLWIYSSYMLATPITRTLPEVPDAGYVHVDDIITAAQIANLLT